MCTLAYDYAIKSISYTIKLTIIMIITMITTINSNLCDAQCYPVNKISANPCNDNAPLFLHKKWPPNWKLIQISGGKMKISRTLKKCLCLYTCMFHYCHNSFHTRRWIFGRDIKHKSIKQRKKTATKSIAS